MHGGHQRPEGTALEGRQLPRQEKLPKLKTALQIWIANDDNDVEGQCPYGIEEEVEGTELETDGMRKAKDGLMANRKQIMIIVWSIVKAKMSI